MKKLDPKMAEADTELDEFLASLEEGNKAAAEAVSRSMFDKEFVDEQTAIRYLRTLGPTPVTPERAKAVLADPNWPVIKEIHEYQHD